MNYKRVYENIIIKANLENRKKTQRDNENYIYYENHHIIPRCLGGSDSKENLVLLTGREHFICHKLLVEIYPDNSKLLYALNIMLFPNSSRMNRDHKISCREYERIRSLLSIVVSNSMKGKKKSSEQIEKQKKQIIPQEQRDRIRLTLTGRKQSIETIEKRRKSTGKRIVSEETRNKLRGPRSEESKKNMKCSDERKEASRTRMTNRLVSEETKEKSRISALNKPTVICPHCNKQGKIGAMNRWHFDNCKLKINNNERVNIFRE